MNKILCIDPGTLNTGWAIWDWKTGVCETGCWRRPKDVEPAKAHEWINSRFMECLMVHNDLEEVWIEMYYPFIGRARANTHAQVLLVGGLLALSQQAGLKTVSVTPREWKDWAKKQAALPQLDNQHARDAMQIGLYAKMLEESI